MREKNQRPKEIGLCRELSKWWKPGRILFSIVVGAFAAQKIRADVAYLQSVGPPPLRFQMFSAPSPLLLAKLFPPRTNAAPGAVASTTKIAEDLTNITAVTNAISASSAPTNAAPVAPAPATEENDNNSLQPSNLSLSPPSASDLLTVNPQMLTEYFKPAQEGTNQTEIVVVPAGIRFTPPTPTVPLQSRAIYKNQ